MGIVCSSAKSTKSSRKIKNPTVYNGDEITINSNFSHKIGKNENITVFYLFVPPFKANDFFHGGAQLDNFFQGGAQLDAKF